MTSPFRFPWVVLVTAVCLLSAGLTSTDGQDPVPGSTPSADTPAGKDVGNEPGKEIDKEAVIREQSIYIPYAKLRDSFEKEGRGVYLPYEKFQELWQAARGNATPPSTIKRPEGALITDADSVATADKEVLRVRAKLAIELLSKGWHSIPIRLGDSAIIQAKIGDEPARVTFDPQQGYLLLLEHTGDKPRSVTVDLEYAKAFAKNPGQNSVSFEAPQAPVNKWQVRIPQAGTKITVEPMIASSELPAAKDGDKPVEETVALAFVGAAPTVRIGWTAKAEGAMGLTALVNAQVQQMIGINEGAVRTRAQITYDITRADLAQLMVEVPADQKVVNVFDPNVRQWDVKSEGDTQQITVQLFQPVRGAQSLVVELERFLVDMNQKEMRLPTVKAVGAGRQQGIVVVSVGTALRAEVLRRVGLTQLGLDELPDNLKSQKWEYSYRYAAMPFDLAMSTEKVLPRIRTTELVEAYLEPEQLNLDLLAVYQIERAGVFQLEMEIPKEYEVRDVRGVPCAAAGAQQAQVDTFSRSGDDNTRLIVNLSQRAIGSVAILVQLRRTLDQPALLVPQDAAIEIGFPLPRIAPSSVESTQGRMVVYAPESLRINLGQQDGLRATPVNEAFTGMESMRAGRFANTRPILAVAYTQQPVNLSLSANRRKPDVSVRQLLVTTINNQSVEYEARFFYDIRYSGVKNLQIKLPADVIKDQVRNDTPGVRERVMPAAEGAAADDESVTWILTGDTEFLGPQLIRLSWKKAIGELEVGRPYTLNIPQLAPTAVNRASGQVVVKKAESLDLRPAGTPRGVRPIDPQLDLFPEAGITDAARAFEFQENWELSIDVARYKLEEVKRTSIEHGLVRMVITRSHKTAVQAVYRVRSARQRMALRLPDKFELDTQPLRINGRPQGLERGDKDELFVPLVGLTPQEPFLLELRYTVPGDHSDLELPEFTDDPAVQQVQLFAYLPKDWALLGSRGPWTDEFKFRRSDFTLQVAGTDVRELFAEVGRGVAEKVGGNLVPDMINGFPTDGIPYPFSTLRPKAAPDGNLKLVAYQRNWVHGSVFIVIAILGMGLTGRTVSTRVVLVLLLVIAWVLLSVFLPTFVMQITDGAMFGALGLVALVWLVELAMKFLAQRPMRAAAAAAAAAAAVTGAAAVTPAAAAEPAAGAGDAVESGGAAQAASPKSDEGNSPFGGVTFLDQTGGDKDKPAPKPGDAENQGGNASQGGSNNG
jgi:hypothetical protein